MNDKNKNEFHTHENYRPHELPIDQPKSSKFTRTNAWLKKRQWYVLSSVVVLALLVGGGITYAYSTLHFQAAVATTAKKKKFAEKTYSKLTGMEVSKKDSQRPVTGVIIENSQKARPQSGIKEAGVVFESVVEAGITRFLLLYQEAKPAVIGPVRSVRPQFASWVAAFDAGLAHVGGSDIPLGKLRSGQIKDLDQFFNAGTYNRVKNRAAPHNVYTSDDKLQALNKSKGYTSSNYIGFTHKIKVTPSIAPTAKTILVPVSTGQFATSYVWDPTTNQYLRSVAGVAHKDREQGQVSPKVVIAMQVPHDVIKDSNKFSYPDVNTSGKAWLFQDGIVTEISWSKTGDKQQIEFKDASGKVVELNPGQTWISALRPDKVPTWQ